MISFLVYNSDVNDKLESPATKNQSISEQVSEGEQGRRFAGIFLQQQHEVFLQQQHEVTQLTGRGTELCSLGYNGSCTDNSERRITECIGMQRSAGPVDKKVNHQQ